MNWLRFSNPIAPGDVWMDRPCAAIFTMRKVLLVGSPTDPESGMRLAQRCHKKLPPLTAGEREQLTALYQMSHILGPGDEITERPFRAPHHTVSGAGLVGGGGGSVGARPGEVSLANHGTLYLDELNEFRREAISTLTATLRAGRVALGRSGEQVVFPAQPFLVIGAVQKLDARAENYATMLGMGIVQETVR